MRRKHSILFYFFRLFHVDSIQMELKNGSVRFVDVVARYSSSFPHLMMAADAAWRANRNATRLLLLLLFVR